jgi:hypothetical protein
MEVGQMADAHSVQGGVEVDHLDLERPRTQPPGLEPSVDEERDAGERHEHEQRGHLGTLEAAAGRDYSSTMGEETNAGLGRSTFVAAIAGIAALVAAQSALHLYEVLHLSRIGTFVDLDRSNGLPDLISTLALLVAVAGAVTLARRHSGHHESATWALAALLAALAIADALHDGPHPSAGRGWSVIALVSATGVLLGLAALEARPRPKATLVVAGVLLVGSFLVNGLDRANQRFERERGDPTAEYQIVAKEGLELLGWSLVALALWDEAFRRRRSASVPDSPAAGRDVRPPRDLRDGHLDVV